MQFPEIWRVSLLSPKKRRRVLLYYMRTYTCTPTDMRPHKGAVARGIVVVTTQTKQAEEGRRRSVGVRSLCPHPSFHPTTRPHCTITRAVRTTPMFTSTLTELRTIVSSDPQSLSLFQLVAFVLFFSEQDLHELNVCLPFLLSQAIKDL